MKRIIILLITIGSAIAFVLFANLESLSSAVFSMPASSLLLLVTLLAGNELLKGMRWSYLLRSSHLRIRRVDAITSYLASQAATALPGGSVLSARLAEEHGQIRMHQAISSLVAQIIADFFSPAAIAFVAILLTGQEPFQIVMPAVTVGIGFACITIIRSRRIAHFITRLLARWRLTRRFVPQEYDFWEHSALLMRPRVMLNTVGIGIVSTIISAITLWIITNAMTDRGVTFDEALYAHSFSVVARHIIPVPSGIGVSDASLAGILNYVGIGLARATFIALAYRTIGMIFRTFLGLLVLVARYPYLVVGSLRVPAHNPEVVAQLVQERQPEAEPLDSAPDKRRAARLPRRHPGAATTDPTTHEAAHHTIR
ncbi:MAG TPA: lysylphosphatidylglycerol synthase transmembrane domain-containing protein [Nitrolancea sp.]|nr:lysylphosphatidylglycerol synthase transmembrane domain-containing protein [Nitrolancea sp.]